MALTINRNIDSMQFMKSSLDSIVKNLMDKTSNIYLKSIVDSGELLKLVKEKGVHLYEYKDSFKRSDENKLPDKCEFFSSLKDSGISE